MSARGNIYESIPCAKIFSQEHRNHFRYFPIYSILIQIRRRPPLRRGKLYYFSGHECIFVGDGYAYGYMFARKYLVAPSFSLHTPAGGWRELNWIFLRAVMRLLGDWEIV